MSDLQIEHKIVSSFNLLDEENLGYLTRESFIRLVQVNKYKKYLIYNSFSFFKERKTTTKWIEKFKQHLNKKMYDFSSHNFKIISSLKTKLYQRK